MRAIATAGLICIASPASADFFNGNELHTACTSSGSLNMYIAGVYDKSNADVAIARFFVPESEVKRNPDLAQIAKSIQPFCVNENVTLQQLRDVVCKWLVNNPSRRHYPPHHWSRQR